MSEILKTIRDLNPTFKKRIFKKQNAGFNPKAWKDAQLQKVHNKSFDNDTIALLGNRM